jgi:hypothetical protein
MERKKEGVVESRQGSRTKENQQRRSIAFSWPTVVKAMPGGRYRGNDHQSTPIAKSPFAGEDQN